MRWYGTDLPCIEGITLITMREYQPYPLMECTVGELPKWMKSRDYNGKWTKPAGLNGKHQCHPEWFKTGEPWPTSLPPTEYGDDWIPLCCGRADDEAKGGFAIGGAVGDLFRCPDPTAGGFVVGGQAGSRPAGVDPTAGGFVLGGAAGDVFSAIDATAGGFVLGGAAGDVVQFADGTEGGVQIGGAAGSVPAGVDPTAGGFVVGGAAGDVAGLVDATAGGVSVGGAAGDALRVPDATAGGFVVGGAAGDVAGLVDAAAGGVSVGGAAGDVLTPGQPTPGTNCATAAAITLGQSYTYTINNGTENWFSVAVTNGTNYPITMTTVSGNLAYLFYEISACPVGTPFATGATNSLSTSRTASGNDFVILRFNASFGTRTYTFQIG